MTKQSPKVHPLANLVLGRLDKIKEQTKTGLFLPKSAQKRIALTEVLAVGPDVQRVKVGDKIVYKDYSQFDLTFEGDELVLVEESDILASIK
jgi:chaperonin GroES